MSMFGINPGTIFAAMRLQQQEAERRHQEMLAQARVRGGGGAVGEQEYLSDDEIREQVRREQGAEDQRAKEREQPAAPFFGPSVEAATLRIPDFSATELPVDAESLRALVYPPNLLVVGGDSDAGWAAALVVQGLLGGQLWGLDLAGLRGFDFSKTVAKMNPWDVLLLASLDRPSGDSVAILDACLPWSDDQSDTPRRAPLPIRKGASARIVHVSLKPSFIVAHSASGKVPGPLAAWGGKVLVPKDTKTCPQCAEEVKAAALICRYCRYEFKLPPRSPQSEPDDQVAGSESLPTPERQAWGHPNPQQRTVTPANAATQPAAQANEARVQLGRLLEMALDWGLAALGRRDDTALEWWIAWTGELVADAFDSEKAVVFRRLSRVSSPQSVAVHWQTSLEDVINNLNSMEIRPGFDPERWDPTIALGRATASDAPR